ncbi:TPA: type I toxin-antitoxin system Ibs family toxin [Escherichia coli]|nr:type I toxin-antitoxin system Ibs family toxin [Escherichia coli]HAL7390935.1 type I toxin-antitoxin system Ibs family toxin [Escherichia coli]HCO7090546.1 type I toxin-antitoxin system Ibs family toxin [Escherichia coli]HDQ1347555.1 type I toxin-antitoxin system Ibs family toxin [Escherichia coli]HDQ1516155.1 type I toxin-antitoxin system Ibs family toxin [Escherichia coli]
MMRLAIILIVLLLISFPSLLTVSHRGGAILPYPYSLN